MLIISNSMKANILESYLSALAIWSRHSDCMIFVIIKRVNPTRYMTCEVQ